MSMPAYLAPGVYLRPQRTDLPDVRIVRTDVAGFVGFAERGPLPLPLPADPGKVWQPEDVAVRITSWDEFRAIFGGVIPNGFLAYAVRGFFENGGTTCHVVRVAALDAPADERPAIAQSAFAAAAAPVFATALSSAAPPGTRALSFGTAVTPGAAMLLELGSASSGLVTTHVLRELSAGSATLAAPLRTGFQAQSTVLGREAALVVEAVSAGSWGNRIRLRLEPAAASGDVETFSLRLTVDSGPDRDHPREEEFYRELSLNPASPAYALTIVNPRSRLVRLRVPPVLSGSGAFLRMARPQPAGGAMTLHGGQDGLTGVTAEDFGLYGPEDDVRGLRALEAIDQVSILCAPDAVFVRQRLAAAPPVPPAPPPPPPAGPAGPLRAAARRSGGEPATG